jgi:protein TonB
MALELSGTAAGLEGDTASPGMQKANSFASGESSLLPLLAPSVPHSSVTTGRKPVSSSRSSVAPVQKSIPPSELVQTPLEPVRPESDPTNSVQDLPVRIESDLGDPASDGTTPQLAAAGSSGPGRIAETSVSHGGAGEEGHATGAAQSGAHGTGGGAAGTDVGHGSAGGGALLDFGTPGGPAIVRLVRPVYPHEARRLGKEGQVILRLSLQASGEVGAIEILQTAGFGMDEAACKAVWQSRFRPASRGGRPVGCQAILPVRFTLR